eukprot:SAG31_NODE_69_length_28130_cov_15.318219_11_plen_55_part_00
MLEDIGESEKDMNSETSEESPRTALVTGYVHPLKHLVDTAMSIQLAEEDDTSKV